MYYSLHGWTHLIFFLFFLPISDLYTTHYTFPPSPSYVRWYPRFLALIFPISISYTPSPSYINYKLIYTHPRPHLLNNPLIYPPPKMLISMNAVMSCFISHSLLTLTAGVLSGFLHPMPGHILSLLHRYCAKKTKRNP